LDTTSAGVFLHRPIDNLVLLQDAVLQSLRNDPGVSGL